MRTIAALLLITTSALAQHRRAISPPPPIPDDAAQLAAIIRTAGTAALSRTPGVSIAIQHNQSYAEGGWGSITPEQNIPATAQSIYWIASATKPFTATAIMRLIEQGKLTLDTPIRTFFPDLATTATVRQLAEQHVGARRLHRVPRSLRPDHRTRQTVGHDGLIRGFQSVVIHYPAERLTVAVLVNRNGSGIASSILDDVTSKVFK